MGGDSISVTSGALVVCFLAFGERKNEEKGKGTEEKRINPATTTKQFTGVVSRIEVVAYSHGSTELLGVQIDAAINR